MRILLTAGLLAAASAPAFGQAFEGAPSYGDINWSPGQSPSSKVVLAAGAMPARWLDSSCSGYISPAPSARLVLGASGDVFIAAGSSTDLTLAIRRPDGRVTCNDDGADGTNPGITLNNAAPGTYEVWVGTFSAGVGHPTTVLHVADSFITDNPFVVNPDPQLEPTQSVSLRAGFNDDPRRFQVRAGGEAPLDTLGSSCYGYSASAPSLAIDYRADDYDLYLMMTSDADGVLAVQTPSGQILCNDDQINLDPGVQIESPESGQYLVWAGLLSDSREYADGELTVSEIGFAGFDNRLDLAAEARFATLELESGFTPDPVSVSVTAGGRVDADIATSDGVTSLDFCVGFVSREPSVELTYEAGALPLYISARGETDLTLVVNGPDGSWLCDDDSGGDLNPEIMLESPQSGVYDIYVGTFSEDPWSDTSAELFISELDGVPAGPQLDLTLEALFGDYTLDAGFTPEPFVIEVQAGGPLEADSAGAGGEWDYCAGNVTQAPSVQLQWDGENGPLYIFAESESDNTLAVNLPDGSWVCDDDSGLSANASIFLANAPSGTYDIYVGLYSGTDTEPATLSISELEAPSDDWD